jgi:hypothetical protein
MKYSLKLLGEGEQHSLFTNPSIPVPMLEGHCQTVVPYRLGMMAMMRRDPSGAVRAYPHQVWCHKPIQQYPTQYQAQME